MKTKLATLLAIAAAPLLCTPAEAQFGAPGVPITWGADDNVEYLDSESRIRLTGRVNVRQGDARLAADAMTIFLTPGASGEDRQVERIEAEGSVIYSTPTETARGDRGVYIAAEDRIELTGRVRVLRGEDVFCSPQLIVHPQRGQFDAVGGGSSNDPLCAGRVRGVISTTTQASAPGSSNEGER